MRKPVSSRKTRCAFSREAFFNAGPFLVDPALDFSLVALHRSALRFLGAPFQSAQQTPDSGDLVMNAKARPNQFGDAGTGPQVRRKAGRLSPLQQVPLQLLQGRGVQLARSARNRLGAQSLRTALADRSLPASDAAPVDAHPLRDLDGRITLAQESQGPLPAPLQFLRASRRSHSTPSTRRIGHYLIQSQ